jgi:hypothetical protein
MIGRRCGPAAALMDSGPERLFEVLTEGGPGKTLLLYRVFTDPGGLIPLWAYNLATRQSLPDLLDSVERRARDLK